MNTQLVILCSALLFTLNTFAGIIPGGVFANSGYIPDGSAVGSSATATVSGYSPSISSISVNLNISGGYNGDLYAYLSYGGVLVPLLNRVGATSGNAFGYSTAGMNVTLADGYTDTHTVLSPTSGGTYSPDGRANPLNEDKDRIGFSAFNGMNPNGTWTLFFADLSSGAQSRVESWSLDIAAVPEPANVALGIFAGVFVVFTLARSRQVRHRVQRWRVAAVHWIDAV